MSLIHRIRHRWAAARDADAVARALREARTPAVREEIRAIASRYGY